MASLPHPPDWLLSQDFSERKTERKYIDSLHITISTLRLECAMLHLPMFLKFLSPYKSLAIFVEVHEIVSLWQANLNSFEKSCMKLFKWMLSKRTASQHVLVFLEKSVKSKQSVFKSRRPLNGARSHRSRKRESVGGCCRLHHRRRRRRVQLQQQEERRRRRHRRRQLQQQWLRRVLVPHRHHLQHCHRRFPWKFL